MLNLKIDETTTKKIMFLCKQNVFSVDNFIKFITSIVVCRFANKNDNITALLDCPKQLNIEDLVNKNFKYNFITIDNNLPLLENIKLNKNSSILSKESRYLSENLLFKEYSLLEYRVALLKITQDNNFKYELISSTAGIAKIDTNYAREVNLLLNYQISNEILFVVDYDKKVFSQSLANNFIVQIKRLILWIINNVNTKLSYFIPLTKEQQEYCLYKYNNTDKFIEATGCVKSKNDNDIYCQNYIYNIYNIFDETVKKYPNKIAIHYHGIDITYSQLEDQVIKMGHSIYKKYKSLYPNRALNNDAIIVCLDRNIELLIVTLAILYLDCSFVFVLTTFPERRIESIYTNSKAILMVTDFNTKLNFSHINTFEINKDYFIDFKNKFEEKNILAREDGFFSRSLNHKNNMDFYAAHVYTSGSTGKPKGAKISHLQIINLLQSFTKGYSINKESKILSVVEVVFDIFYMEFFLSILNGSTFVFCNYKTKNNPKLFSDYIKTTKPTIIEATLTFWSFVNEYLPRNFLNCTAVMVGEKITKKAYKELTEFSKDIRAAYGITELTVFSTVYKVNENNVCDIGKPISNTKFYVLDNNLNFTPIGVNGILYVSGIGLAKGYINNEKLTKELFLNNHIIFRNIDTTLKKGGIHSILYKTNDIVKWNFDNTLEIIGRADQEVKVRGNRVNLTEIEDLLSNFEKIKESVATLKDYKNEKYVVIYFIPLDSRVIAEDDEAIKKDIQKYLEEYLPPYMMPNAYIAVKNFPLTNTGKIDKNLLPQINFQPHDQEKKNKISPEATLKYKIKLIWQKVLNIDDVDSEVEFFNVGGHSLLVMQLASLINEELHLDLPLIWFYQHNTITTQFEAISKNKSNSFFCPIVKLTKTKATLKLFLIHTPLGGIEVYENLAKALDGKVECYGIDNYNLNSGKESITDMESLASTYIKYIKQQQSHGPYYILGWSLGGNFAFYIASKLQKSDDVVKKLYILDAYPINKLSIAQLKKYNFFESEEFFPKIWDIYFPPHIANEIKRIPENYKQRLVKSIIIAFKISVDCNIRNYDGDAMLVRATHGSNIDLQYSKSSQYGWKRHFKNLIVKEIDTNHFELLYKKNAEIVANYILNDICQNVDNE